MTEHQALERLPAASIGDVPTGTRLPTCLNCFLPVPAHTVDDTGVCADCRGVPPSRTGFDHSQIRILESRI